VRPTATKQIDRYSLSSSPLRGREERKGRGGPGVGLAGDGGGAGVPGGAGRDAAGARGVVRSARRPVPAEAVAPAHPQARPIPTAPGSTGSVPPPPRLRVREGFADRFQMC